VYKFLAAQLQLKDLPEATETIPIETPQQLQVFSLEHPLPSGAARHSQAVADAFRQLVSSRDND
jgi:hypothetical protein